LDARQRPAVEPVNAGGLLALVDPAGPAWSI